MLLKLDDTISLLDKIVCGQNLSSENSERLFTNIFLNDKDGYHLAALSAAIHAKGETADELLGFCKSSESLGEKINPNVDVNLITDLAGTGGGKIKTINVSTAASFVVSALGFVVAKQAGYAQTSPTGSGDIFRAFGIDTFKLSIAQVEKTLEKFGICPYYLSAMSPKMKNRSLIAKKIFVDKKLRIHSPFHIAAFAYSPTKLNKRIYGCYSEKYLEVLGELFIKLGNKRTLVIHGLDGLPEVSNVGKTTIVEQIGSKLKKMTLDPADFGIKKAKLEDIQSGGREQNIIDFLRVLSGEERGAKRDLVLINASASLYTMGKVTDFQEGTKLASKVIDDGTAYNKLKMLTKYLGDKNIFNKWQKKAI